MLLGEDRRYRHRLPADSTAATDSLSCRRLTTAALPRRSGPDRFAVAPSPGHVIPELRGGGRAFEGFESVPVDVGEASAFVRFGGAGPPAVLLHGHPSTSATWHRVAPLLVQAGHAVVCPDLRGTGAPGGRSHGGPRGLLQAGGGRVRGGRDAPLGHDRFALVGHDRGGAMALRLTLDHPETVSRIALVDCVPATEHLSRITAEFATRWWRSFFFAQPDIPERVITADPDSWYHGDPMVMGQENYDEWRRATRNSDVVRAMLEPYRAGFTVGCGHEEADRTAGARVACPALILWSLQDDLEELYGDPRAVWSRWADDVRGHGVDSASCFGRKITGATFISRR
ncbi:alpha/beta hydrolase [Streptomyces sp. MBT53]|uniref:alpha/beta hydrolase n=1 Tax=Streptomyces sp. MBT53 TaxID=1488384 RepID=UPI0027DAAA50|nr:alpha/beta hydrolase [Streptomyces sp. MBT53]